MPKPRPDQLSPAHTTRWQRLWAPFWAVPAALVFGSLMVGLFLPTVDAALSEHLPYVFQGGTSGARTVLSTIATSMITVTSLVFSITMVVLQLASSQFTPRVLSGFLSNRIVQTTLGVFLSAFIYSLTVLRMVRSGERDWVPQASVTFAFLLVLASVVLFVAFIHHITQTIQVTRVISAVGDAAARVMDDYYPTEEVEQGPPIEFSGPLVFLDDRHGYLTDVNFQGLVELARKHDTTIDLIARLGDALVMGDPVAQLRADLPEDAEIDVNAYLYVDTERVQRSDPAFGLRQLNDIAMRALSPGINDPTTAVECVQEVHRLLRPIVARPDPGVEIADDDGHVRLIWRPELVGEMLRRTFIELIHYGGDVPSVSAAMRDVLAHLAADATPENRTIIEQVSEHLQASRVRATELPDRSL